MLYILKIRVDNENYHSNLAMFETEEQLIEYFVEWFNEPHGGQIDGVNPYDYVVEIHKFCEDLGRYDYEGELELDLIDLIDIVKSNT
jgi:hypothetical protein